MTGQRSRFGGGRSSAEGGEMALVRSISYKIKIYGEVRISKVRLCIDYSNIKLGMDE